MKQWKLVVLQSNCFCMQLTCLRWWFHTIDGRIYLIIISCHVLVWTGSICKFKVKSDFRNMNNTCWLLFGWWEHWYPNIEIQAFTSKQLSIAYCATLTSQSHPRDQSPATLFTMAPFSLFAKNFYPTYKRTWSTIDQCSKDILYQQHNKTIKTT